MNQSNNSPNSRTDSNGADDPDSRNPIEEIDVSEVNLENRDNQQDNDESAVLDALERSFDSLVNARLLADDDEYLNDLDEVEDIEEPEMPYKSPDEITNICAICIDEVKKAATIKTCGHSFCAKCLVLYLIHRYSEYEERLERNDDSFVPDICPYCRGEFDFKDLPLLCDKYIL